MNVRYPLILASILILVILVSGCSDIFGTAKDKTCDFCKDRFESECNKCPEGVNKDFVTVDPISSKCIEQCYGVSAPLNTDCNTLREICSQVFGGTTTEDDEPPGGDEEVINCWEYCKSENYENGQCFFENIDDALEWVNGGENVLKLTEEDIEELFEGYEKFRTRGWMCSGGIGGGEVYESLCYYNYKKINKKCDDFPNIELYNSHCTCSNFDICGYGSSFEEAEVDCEDNKCTASGCTG